MTKRLLQLISVIFVLGLIITTVTQSDARRKTAKRATNQSGLVETQIWLKSFGKDYSIKELRNLRKLDLSETKVSKADVVALKKSLPDCAIDSDYDQ